MTFRTRMLTAAFASLVASSVSAQALAEDSYPLVYGQRPIVLTKDLSEVEAAFSFLKLDIEGSDLLVSLAASYDFGLTEDVTLGVLAVPVGLSPTTSYGQPQAYATARLIDQEKLEVGARARLTFPGPDGGDLGLGAGLVGRFYLSEAAFLNVGALVNVTLSSPSFTHLEIPIDLGVSLTRNLFLAIHTGIVVPEFEIGDLTLPLHAGLGYTVGTERPVFDLFARAGVPFLITGGGTRHSDLQIDIGGRYYFE
jgi:hypothetical protein